MSLTGGVPLLLAELRGEGFVFVNVNGGEEAGEEGVYFLWVCLTYPCGEVCENGGDFLIGGLKLLALGELFGVGEF